MATNALPNQFSYAMQNTSRALGDGVVFAGAGALAAAAACTPVIPAAMVFGIGKVAIDVFTTLAVIFGSHFVSRGSDFNQFTVLMQRDVNVVLTLALIVSGFAQGVFAGPGGAIALFVGAAISAAVYEFMKG